jgi:hypothetical protein
MLFEHRKAAIVDVANKLQITSRWCCDSVMAYKQTMTLDVLTGTVHSLEVKSKHSTTYFLSQRQYAA